MAAPVLWSCGAMVRSRRFRLPGILHRRPATCAEWVQTTVSRLSAGDKRTCARVATAQPLPALAEPWRRLEDVLCAAAVPNGLLTDDVERLCWATLDADDRPPARR